MPPDLPPLPDHPEPVNGYWTARRAQKHARRRALATGVVLQRVGAAVAVALLVWFTIGDDVVGRWRQHTARAEMAAQLRDPSRAEPAGTPAPAPAGRPVFGLGGSAGQAVQATLVQLPGEDVGAPTRPSAPGPEPDVRQPAAATLRMRVPQIGMDWVVVDGVGRGDLKAGPGWMPWTAPPGSAGNTVIAGHRTTYGAPFNRIDELDEGAQIILDLPGGGQAVYEVRDRFVVEPTEVGVTAPTDGSRLTLTTCTPTGSARYRLIVQAEQVSGPAADVAAAVPWAPYAGARIDDPALRD